MIRRLLGKIEDYRFNKKMSKQRYKKGYADCDVWGMHYWFGETFAKMVRRLADMKHGYPAQLTFEEVETFPIDWVEEQSVIIDKELEKNDYEPFDFFDEFCRWQLVLLRIAYCLEQTNDEITKIKNEYADEYHKQVWGDVNDYKNYKEWFNAHHEVKEYDKNGKPMTWTLITNEPEPELKEKFWNRDKEIAQWRDDCKDEAFDLLKKYFWCLWD